MDDQMSDNMDYRQACVRVFEDKAERCKAVLQPCKQRKLAVVPGKRRSFVWKHFDILADQGRLRAQCRYCRDTNYRAEGYFGTSNCRKHLTNCKAYKTALNRKLIADNTDRVSSGGFDEKVYCQLFADAILLHGCPSSIIENEGLRKLLAYLNPKVNGIPSTDVKKIVEAAGATQTGLSDDKKAKEDEVVVVNDSDADAESLICVLD